MPKSALFGIVFALLFAPAIAQAQDEDRCAPREPGVQCGEGNGRQTEGGTGTGKVSHAGWPKITGILWMVRESAGTHEFAGTEDNDELLGHHGDDTVIGLEGKDVLWGDWELKGNGSNQSDTLRGGDGNDFLYPSHGKNNMYGGAGNDRIIAYYGHGTIDCGPGTADFVQTRENGAYKVKNCEIIRHFCAFGSKPNGECKKPGEGLAFRQPLRLVDLLG